MVVDNMVQSEALAEVIHWMVRQIAGKYREFNQFIRKFIIFHYPNDKKQLGN